MGGAMGARARPVAAIVAREAACPPTEVAVGGGGRAPASFVVPWSDASIGGYALERVISQVQLRRIEARVARLWPPGPYALGAAAARVVEAMLQDSRKSYNVETLLGGEFGVRDRVGVVPALLARDRFAQTRVPALNTRERVQLDIALGA